jgi:hypothetical protein
MIHCLRSHALETEHITPHSANKAYSLAHGGESICLLFVFQSAYDLAGRYTDSAPLHQHHEHAPTRDCRCNLEMSGRAPVTDVRL